MWKRLKSPRTIVVVLVLAFAVVLGRSYYRSRMGDALSRELEERGVEVSWEYGGPPWLERFWPEDVRLFQRLVIYELPLGDDELLTRVLAHNPYVGAVTGVVDSAVTDATLRRLAGLAALHRLYLSQTQVTDAGLQHLPGLTGLHWLDLSQTQVTDAGLQHLAGLTGLTYLDLSQTQVTDAGLQHLAGLTELRQLKLL